MTEQLDESTREALRSFIRDLDSLPNESAKTHRFVGLVSELFPGSKATAEFPRGIEKVVRIRQEGEEHRRRIDAFYGNAVIEFENSLDRTEATAKKQLREQTAGVWSEDGSTERPVLCVASDGHTWKTFRPIYEESGSDGYSPSEIDLEPLRTLELSEDSLGDFWLWLTSLLFRPGNLRPTVDRFRADFGIGSLAYGELMEALKGAWKAGKNEPENALLFTTWKQYLTVTYGSLEGTEQTEDALERLFLKHTYLASIAKLLVWAFLTKGETDKKLGTVIANVFSGHEFLREGIENLGEEDFFRWVQDGPASRTLQPHWERALNGILTYDLAHFDQDILKGIYQELVDPKDRHDLGEYYTPDWLCEKIVSKVLPSGGHASVLDPACGSGSFLRAAIAHFKSVNPSEAREDQLRTILENVAGIDIHPLAVIIAKATYILALGKLVEHGRRAISIPVYMADSLFLPREVSQPDLGEEPGVEITFGDRSVRIPESLVTSGDLFDRTITACTRVAIEHARMAKESEDSLGAYLERHVPAVAKEDNFEPTRQALWKYTSELAELIEAGKDSIWSFVIRNAYRPAMFKSQFDFIIGNPPWLSYRYISAPDYQDRIKELAISRYGIAPKQKRLFTHMELATIFFVHTLTTFGKEDSKLAFVMPRSILSADQHTHFRQRKFVGRAKWTGYWDLLEVKPLFRVPSCVVFADYEMVRQVQTLTLEAEVWEGQLPQKDIPWSVAEEHLTSEQKEAHLIYMGDRTAVSVQKGFREPTRSSPYSRLFRQGATIVPRNFYFVAVEGLDFPPDPDDQYWAETEPEQAKLSKPPYKKMRFEGSIEGRFLFRTVISKNVLPFLTVQLPLVTVPVVMKSTESEVWNAHRLRDEGYRGMGDWMARAEKKWREARGRKADRMSVYERLDYQNGLSNQGSGHRHLVLYNASGTDLSVARVDREQLDLPFVVDHKLYWLECETVEEARYLTAFLNAREINRRIKPFQSMGLQGQRDIHKKPLDLPIPQFQSDSALHGRLADLAAEAEACVLGDRDELDLDRSLARQRRWARRQVSEVREEIDQVVDEIFEQQA